MGRNWKRQLHGKAAARPLLTLHPDLSAHAVHQTFHNGHPQSGALDAVHSAAAYPLEWEEDPLQKFTAHADAVVLAEEVQPDHALLPGGPLGKENVDCAARLGVFHSVADDVHQDLPQAKGVACQALLVDFPDFKAQGLLLLSCLGPDDDGNIMRQIRQGKPLLIERHPPAVDSGHIQYIVDQTHQVGGGSADFVQTVLNSGLLIDVAQTDGRHSHDGIHGGADIVGHTGEKPAFGPVGLLRRFQRPAQRFIFLRKFIHAPVKRGGVPVCRDAFLII